MNSLQSAYHHAKKLGGESKSSFRRCLRVLNRIKRHEKQLGLNPVINFYPDFVPHSFLFQFSTGLHGAVILHGSGVETLAVTIEPITKPTWTLHT